MNSERLKGHICIFIANVIFGIYIPLSKFILAEYLSGGALTILRLWGATALFWFASLFIQREKISKKDLFLMFIFGAVGISANQGFFILGLGMTSPVDASVIVTATPLMVMVIAALFLRDPITSRKGLGVFFGLSGALWLILSTGRISSSSGSWSGDSLILLSGLSSALYFTFSKPLTSRHSPVTLMKWMFLFSSLVFLPITPDILSEAEAFKHPFDLKILAMFIYVVFGATFTTYFLIAMAIKRMRPTTMAMYNYVQPFISSVVAISIGQDSFSLEKCGAAVLVFIGVYLVTSSPFAHGGTQSSCVLEKSLKPPHVA